MPQMMPMFWILMFFLIFFIFIFSISLLFYIYSPSMYYLNTMKNNFYWSWLW